MARFINSPQRDREARRDNSEDDKPSRQPRGRHEQDDEEDRDDPDRADDQDRQQKSRAPAFSGAQAVRYARQYLEEVIGLKPESVSGLSRSNGGWKVNLDVVELERVPRSTDVLASYEVELDENGDLAGYRRISRYYRNQVDER
jgi:hypothetical protein